VNPQSQCCATCRLYLWARTPSGRKTATRAGDCAWRPPWPERWSAAYTMGFAPPTPPHRMKMWPNAGVTCQTWEPVP